MTWRVVAVVTALWTLVGVVSGAQGSLAAALQGASPEPLGPAIVDALNQFLPWIPATLVAVALAGRVPLTRTTWRRNVWIHLLAAPATAYLTNLLVVAAYGVRQGMFLGFGALAEQAAVWGLVRLHIAALFYAAAVAVTLAIRSWRDIRRREVELARLETLLAQTRLQVLNAQIRPHFLFNTLHTIGQLWRSGRSQEADAMLDHLGSLFQKVIASTSRTQIPLSEELAMVRDYLAIEEARFGDRIRSKLTIEDGAQSCLVPPLLLQPLVENAVKHGLSPSAAGGTVWVDARIDGRRLLLRVRDDGAGPVRSDGPLETAGTGTGLSNVRERLAGLYGEHQRLETTARDGAGTEVRLELPVTTEASTGADPQRPFRAVVADDEQVAREAVLTLLADQRAVEVVGEAASGEETVAVVRRTRPDLVFLDVQMPAGDGFRVLESLGADVPRGVVFVTAFDEHAVRAFEVHALDYVVKPFGKPRFDAAVARAVARLQAEDALSLQRTLEALVAGRQAPGPAGTLAAETSARARPERLAVRTGSRTMLVPVADVEWIESDGDYANIHAAGKVHLVSARMHVLESLLDPQRFVRVHRSIIVCLAQVSELHREDDGGGTAVLRSGVRLRVARSRWEDLERALAIG